MSSILQNTTLIAFMQDNEIKFLEVIHEQEPMEESCPIFFELRDATSKPRVWNKML